MKRIDLIVSPQGECRLETTGFTGGSCKEASRFLEHALGAVSSEQLTSEYFESQPNLHSHSGVDTGRERS